MNINQNRPMQRLTEQLNNLANNETGLEFWLSKVQHDVNQGYYFPMPVMKQMKDTEPNYNELIKQVFAYINERNSGINEKYENDQNDDSNELDIIHLGSK